MFKAVTFTIFLIGAYISGSAQNSYTLQGHIISSNSYPVESATILLKTFPDSVLYKTAFTGTNGLFKFVNLPKGDYLITVTALAYQQVTKLCKISTADYDIGSISLIDQPRNLKEVGITAKKELIEVKPGKVILNVNGSIISTGNNALDILKKAPGVLVDEHETISLNGKHEVVVMLDGKPSYLSAEDLINLLQTTQSSTIDQIELISNPGANYEAAGGAGIINIRLKKDKNAGKNGVFNLSGGISHLNNTTAANYRLAPSIALNSRSKKINVFGNYSYTDNDISRKSNLYRNINTNGVTSGVDLDYSTQTSRYSHAARAGLDYFTNPKDVIGLLVNSAYSITRLDKRNISMLNTSGKPEAEIFTNSGQERKVYNVGINLNYKRAIGKKNNELSADVDYSVFNRESDELLNIAYKPYNTGTPASQKLLKNNSPAHYDIKSIKADYAISLTGSASITLGSKISRVVSNNSLDFGSLYAMSYTPDPKFTNDFSFKELITGTYANYAKTYKKGSLQLGLRTEFTSSKGTSVTTGNVLAKNYLNLFPNIAIVRQVDPDNQLYLSYSRRIDRPAYEDLNPFIGYLDQYSYRSGNPGLSSQYTNNIEATHILKHKYSTTLRYSIANNAFSMVYIQDDKTCVVTQMRQNLDKMYAYGVIFNAPLKPVTWWTANINLSALNIRYVSNSAGGSLNNGRPDITIKSLNSFSLPKGFNAEVSGKYQSPSFYGILNYQQIFNVDAGISKSLFNKRASLRLSASDIFNTDATKFSSNYQNLDLYGKDKVETHILLVNFSWQFGKTSIDASRRRNSGSDTEQNRVGSL